jgi:hypothetical protein
MENYDSKNHNMEEYREIISTILEDHSLYVINVHPLIEFVSRVEFAVIPGMTENVVYKDGLLLLNESCCVNLLQKAQNLCSIDSLQLLRMCITPVDPDWENPPPLCDSRTLRLNSVALRFFTNCSSLWRFRLIIMSSLHPAGLSVPEPNFLQQLAGFKAFNYHLYDYWLKCVLVSHNSDLRLVHLNSIVDQAIKDPSNFSPFHVLQTCLTEGIFDPQCAHSACSRLVSRTPTEAIIEFAVCLCLLPNVPTSLVSLCRSIIPKDSLFIDILD